MNAISLEVYFADFALLHCTAKTFAWYLISQNKSHIKFKAFTVICSGNLVANFTKIFHV